MCRLLKPVILASLFTIVLNVAVFLPIAQSEDFQLPWNIDDLTLTTQNSTIVSYPCNHSNLIRETITTKCFDLRVNFDHCQVKVDSCKGSPLLLRQENFELYTPGSKHPAYLFTNECLFNLDQAHLNANMFLKGVISLNVIVFAWCLSCLDFLFRRRARQQQVRENY
jgi:hypothetical protein